MFLLQKVLEVNQKALFRFDENGIDFILDDFDDAMTVQKWLPKLPEKSFYIEDDEGQSFNEADIDSLNP